MFSQSRSKLRSCENGCHPIISHASMGRLDNKVVLITGSSGMGAATARMAAAEGARVFIAALAPEECESLSAEVGGGWYAGDLAVEDNARAAVETLCRAFRPHRRRLQCRGNQRPRFGDGPLHECSAEGWDTLINVNLRSLFLVSREAVRHMLAAEHGGSIVNMGSVVALSPEPRYFATHAYATGKGAIHAFTTATAAYYAPIGHPIQRGCAGIGGNAHESASAAKPGDPDVHAGKAAACEGIDSSGRCGRRRRISTKRCRPVHYRRDHRRRRRLARKQLKTSGLVRYIVRAALFPNRHVNFVPLLLRRAVRVLLQRVFAFELHHDDVLVAFRKLHLDRTRPDILQAGVVDCFRRLQCLARSGRPWFLLSTAP